MLIKKGNDTNIFISAEAEKTLISMCTYISEHKVLSTILSHAGNRSPPVKAKVAKCLEQIIVKLNTKIMTFREKEKIVDQLAIYLSDASQDVRNNAKQAFRTLSNLVSKDDFEKLMTKSLNEQKYNKVKEFLEKGFNTSMSEFSPSKQSFYRGNSNRTSRKAKLRANGGNYASDGFDNSGYKASSMRFNTSKNIHENKSSSGSSHGFKRQSYGQRTPILSKNSKTEYEPYPRYEGGSGSSMSGINTAQNRRIQKVIPPRNADVSNTDTEDNKNSSYSPSKSSKQQRRIPKRIIRKLDEKSIPRAPDFGRRDMTEITQASDERSIFDRLRDPDTKVASKAAENILNSFEEYK